MNVAEKFQQLQESLAQYNSVAVAFSGGVDSTFLLQSAALALGPQKVLALTVSSALSPDFELAASRVLAKKIGVRQQLVKLDLLEITAVATNDAKRCYHCKRALYTQLLKTAQSHGIKTLLDGSNLDDLHDYRPGQAALKELCICSPLLDAELTKQDIRDLSKKLELSTWDKPPFACLASRFPYGIEITEQRLRQVERCEDWLRQQGFRNYRVRYHEDLARIELPAAEISRLLDEKRRQQLVAEFKSSGFTYITLDLQGYRSGSLNETL